MKEHLQICHKAFLPNFLCFVVGISKEYWTVKANGFVICTICNAELQTHNSMLAHLESDRHIQMYEFWCSLYNADKVNTFFYTKVTI